MSSKGEIEALGLDNTQGCLVVGVSNPRSNFPDLMETIRADQEEDLAKPSHIPIDFEKKK